MQRWSRAEIERAFRDYTRAVVEIGQSGDWSRYADLFTEDAVYVEHAFGEMHGREEIRNWIASTMSVFPTAARLPRSRAAMGLGCGVQPDGLEVFTQIGGPSAFPAWA